MDDRYETLFDAEARVEAIYPLLGIGDPDAPPSWIEEFLESCGPKEYAGIAERCPDLGRLELGERSRVKDAAADLAQMWLISRQTGFFVLAHVNVRTYQSDTAFWSGPGHVRIHWLFVASADEAIPLVLDVASRQHEKSKSDAMIAARKAGGE